MNEPCDVQRNDALPLYRRSASGRCTIPEGMNNVSKLRELGLRPRPDAQPVAQAWVCVMAQKPRLVNLFRLSDWKRRVGKNRRATSETSP